MLVKELIVELQKLPKDQQDMTVCFVDCESGELEIDRIRLDNTTFLCHGGLAEKQNVIILD